MTHPAAITLRIRHGRGTPALTPLDPTAGRATLAAGLDRADMLVVLDALAFPFDALREQDRDIPLVLGLHTATDAAEVEAALGRDVVDHLTALDTLVGRDGPIQDLLASRCLPSTCHVRADDPVACALSRQQVLTEQWDGSAGATDPTRYERDWLPGPTDLRSIKARRRLDQQVLRDALRGVGLHRPPVIRHAGIVADRPESIAPALAGTAATWSGAGLGPAPDLPADLDAVLLVGDVLHHPQEQVEALLGHCITALRPDGWLLALWAVVPDPREEPANRPVPLAAGDIAEMADAMGRLIDVRAVRRPAEDHYRAGLFVVASPPAA